MYSRLTLKVRLSAQLTDYFENILENFSAKIFEIYRNLYSFTLEFNDPLCLGSIEY